VLKTHLINSGTACPEGQKKEMWERLQPRLTRCPKEKFVGAALAAIAPLPERKICGSGFSRD